MSSNRIGGTAGHGKNGYALVAVLVSVAILSALVVVVQRSAGIQYALHRNALTQLSNEAIAEAALARAGLDLRRMADGGPPVPFNQRVGWQFDGAEIGIMTEPEIGKVDINHADRSLLARVFAGVGAETDMADALSARVIDWRSPDNLRELGGAIDEDYARAGLPYRPRHAPFQSVNELSLVLGMPDELIGGLDGLLTVFSQRPVYDPAFVRPSMRRVLGLDPFDSISAEPGSPSPGEKGPTPPSRPALVIEGQAFTIRIRGENAGGFPIRYRAVIRVTRGPDRPWMVLAWRQDGMSGP